VVLEPSFGGGWLVCQCVVGGLAGWRVVAWQTCGKEVQWASGQVDGWLPGGSSSGGLVGLEDGGPAGRWAVAQQTCRADSIRVVALGWWPALSFSVLWSGEAFHGLLFQGANVSVLPCALPQPRVSPASQQDP
jgi:hypothetical protein